MYRFSSLHRHNLWCYAALDLLKSPSSLCKYVFETFKEYVLLHFPTYFQNRAICALQSYLESLEMRFFKEL